jgi:hypothetical protein
MDTIEAIAALSALAQATRLDTFRLLVDAAVTQLANGAARGDKKSIQLVFALLQALEPAIEAQRPVYFLGGVLTQGDRTI